ncbi:unnamed protein product [Haemonchus placei]|uniref:Transthyretin-like family protein n=1 Tax=Haemonchus placei TaxID=6290 RepID=A0A0N4VS43_HAEPC|nr:unnamed protein product [Haemonchus placei]
MELLLLLSALFIPVLPFLEQHIGVYGRLMCGAAPLCGNSVQLWSNKVLGVSHEIASNTTDGNGFFRIHGNESSVFPLNLRLKIMHHCLSPSPCIRKLNLPLPSEYIFRGSGVWKWFDAGRLNLAYRFPNEKLSCQNKTVKS